MPSLTISRLLVVFGVVVTGGLVASIGLQTVALKELKIGGPVYREIANGKDLIADILPPPLYALQAYMLANETMVHPERAGANLEAMKALRLDFDARKTFWAGSDLDPRLHFGLAEQVVTSGEAFWSVATVFEEAKARGDAADLQPVMDAFYVHDAKVRAFAALATSTLATSVENADFAGTEYTLIGAVSSGASVLLFLAGLWFVRRRAIRPLVKIGDAMSVLSGGNYAAEVPFAHRTDEIGAMARALTVFRAGAIERQQMRAAAEQDRSLSEAQRLEQQRHREREADELRTVVETLGAGLGRLAECNIRNTLDQPFADRFEPLRLDFNQSLATFQLTLEQVLGKTTELSGNASEMYQAADELSKRTEQQAAALEQTSAALDEVTATVKSSADRAAETRSLVGAANRSATSSSQVVRDAVEAMQRIDASSNQIGQIIHVIDEIAFQTNLLALNAGVEAARAGDAGRGFAVVAQEVRELAQRSAAAAKDINALIRTSSSDVSDGVRLVDQTGRALAEIAQYVMEIDAKVEAITTGSKEQSVGLLEISTAVNAIDQMTQKNAAMVEETTAISSNLASDATALSEIVNRFQLNPGRQVAASTTPTRHRAA
ncbi:methyl-accepting chemotaxis protein [Rhizobium sp. DKSPLA3]|uniref:Methyl-accepting chemotaxis protein n=1 Tax=Rhizobium quercicola TaxID=2901226 RepID=A0A9X1NW87_9HYPH|nr:methyl-accepting chemotaxis protein [Rhizobium quercicola]MCD7110451.1 methyl-accepting chemotaxis protein [Rhizobium quercicola]